MQGTPFRFKQFTIHQDKSAMKVGTDGVLLGSWINPLKATQILDIGTGTGLIAIMMAQKSDAHITGIDIDNDSADQAKVNSEESPWKNRIQIQTISLQDFVNQSEKKFDLIVSNPPYFGETMASTEDAKTKAKHTSTLSYQELLNGVKSLLETHGKFCVILPYQKGMDFREMAAKEGLYCHQGMRVITLAGKSGKRVMMEFGFQKMDCVETEITVQDEHYNYTREYIDMTADFYLSLK